ncbi:hypothetical protein LguiA_025986 [Lonicera macranthoides]
MAAQVLEDLYEHLDLGDNMQSSSDFSNEALQVQNQGFQWYEVAENNSGNVDGNSSAGESSKTVGNEKNGRGSLVNSTNLIQVEDHGNLNGNFQSQGNPLFQGNNNNHLLVNNNSKMIMEKGSNFEAGDMKSLWDRKPKYGLRHLPRNCFTPGTLVLLAATCIAKHIRPSDRAAFDPCTGDSSQIVLMDASGLASVSSPSGGRHKSSHKLLEAHTGPLSATNLSAGRSSDSLPPKIEENPEIVARENLLHMEGPSGSDEGPSGGLVDKSVLTSFNDHITYAIWNQQKLSTRTLITAVRTFDA